MQGKIMKGIAGFYYVHANENQTIYECKAKGVFRNNHIKPLVGDNVEMEVLDEEHKKGNLVTILPRKNELIRPAVANIDQALVIFSIVKPSPTFNLLDRFLISMKRQGIDSIICFNKKDIATSEEQKKLKDIYESCHYKVIFVSAQENQGMDEVEELLRNKTTAVAGPSGVGKSSIVNRLQPMALMETGEISVKIQRGKHTTRHTEIIAIKENTYIMDTPGFSSLSLFDVEKEELKMYFPEFDEFEKFCRFQGCAHINEPNCGVKEALEEKKISEIRYGNYVGLYTEISEKRRY